MDVSVDNEVIVNTNGTVEVAVGNAADAVVADDHALDITVTKKEYKIVGDEVYIAKLYKDAPQWMKDLVQLVVDNTMWTESAMLRNDLIRQLNQFATSYVPLNQYTQSILDLSNADTSMHATLETLNSNFNDGLDTANAQIINLNLTKASKDEVVAKTIETLAAQLATPTSELGAIIGNLQQTIVDGDSANADSVTTLMSVLEGEVDARASAIETINTYVGLVDGIPNGTGLLASIDDLQNQIDGNIATWFYDGIPTLLTAPAVLWTTGTEKASHIGDIYYDKTSGYGYRFSYEDIIDTPNMGVIYSWIRIVDTDVVKALADAANAQSTADGKVVTFYQATAPTAEGIGDLWIDSDAGNKMYRWNGSSWGTDLVGTMVANASAVTSLSTELSNGTTTWAAADSTVVNSLNTTISNGDAAVEAKWAYNSALTINGTTYNSGFGLSNSAGTGIGSEFWVDASRFKFTNSAKTGSTAPFTIDASGATPQITFNGKVSFSNVSGAPSGSGNLLYNSAPALGNEQKGWQIGWYNTNIVPVLGSGSDPWRPSGGGSVYATIPGAPTIGGVFDVAQTNKVPVVGGSWYDASAYISAHRCTSYVTITWFDSNDTYINEVGGSQVATAGSGALTNWGRTMLFAQAPANAAKASFYIRNIVTSADPYCYVAFAYLGKSVVGQTVHSDWSEGTSAGATRTGELTNDAGFTTLSAVALQGYVLPAGVANAINTNTTTINGSKITTGSVSAATLSATAIYGKTINITDTSASGGIMPDGTSSLGLFDTNRDKNALGAINRTSGGYAISGVCTNTGSSVGVHGRGNWGVLGEAMGGGFGFYTLSPSYFESAIYPFTGAHLCLCDELPEVGDILSAYDAYNLTVDNSLPYTALSASPNDAKVFGVYNGKVDDLLAAAANSSMLGEKTEDGRRIKPEYEEYLRALVPEYLYIGVNALGEGGINVCSAGGNISAGDYITTSDIRGKGMKQEDNVMHNYTVAKALESVDWTTEQSTTKMIACTYHCG